MIRRPMETPNQNPRSSPQPEERCLHLSEVVSEDGLRFRRCSACQTALHSMLTHWRTLLNHQAEHVSPSSRLSQAARQCISSEVHSRLPAPQGSGMYTVVLTAHPMSVRFGIQLLPMPAPSLLTPGLECPQASLIPTTRPPASALRPFSGGPLLAASEYDTLALSSTVEELYTLLSNLITLTSPVPPSQTYSSMMRATGSQSTAPGPTSVGRRFL